MPKTHVCWCPILFFSIQVGQVGAYFEYSWVLGLFFLKLKFFELQTWGLFAVGAPFRIFFLQLIGFFLAALPLIPAMLPLPFLLLFRPFFPPISRSSAGCLVCTTYY